MIAPKQLFQPGAWRGIAGMLIGVTLFFSGPLAQADDRARVFVGTFTTPITLDGHLTEDAWAGASTIYPSHVHGEIPLEPMALKLLWSAKGLYIGAHCLDTDLRGQTSAVDTKLWQDGDVVELFFIPPAGELSRIELQFNASGGHTDIGWKPGKRFGPETVGWNWEGMRHAVALDGTLNDEQRDRSWSLEVFLPWDGLAAVGIKQPQPQDSWRFMAMIVNRTQLAPNRSGRALTCWPIVTRALSSLVEEYGELTFSEKPAVHVFEGFETLEHGSSGHMGALRPDYRGLSPMWEADEHNRLVWQTQKLPEKLPVRCRLLFAVENFGSPSDEPLYELWLDGVKVIAFGNFKPEDQTIVQQEVVLRYHHRQGGSRLRNGVLELDVPAAMLTPGKPAMLQLKRIRSDHPDELRLFGRGDVAAHELMAGRIVPVSSDSME